MPRIGMEPRSSALRVSAIFLFRLSLFTSFGLAICWMATPSPAATPTMCPPQYLGNYPKEAEEDWTDDCQGITHDATHWYINQRRVLFRIPVERDLWQDHKNEPGVSYRHIDDIPELDGYDHMGGSSSFEYNGTWYILVPVDKNPNADAVIAVFRADASLSVVGLATIPGQPDGAGWVAVGPDGYVYTSVSFPNYIRKLSMNWSTIEQGPTLTFESLIFLKDENGAPYQLFHMQGGAVTPDNSVLFINNGLGDCFFEGGGTESDSFGLHAFDLATGQRILRSCQSGCAFRFQFNLCFFGAPDEEPEGITYWDLDNGAAPGVGGQLHVILLDNDLITSDVYLKHYRVGGTLNPTIACPRDALVECTQVGGTPRTDPQLAEFFAVAATIGCDESIAVTDDAPDVFPHGQTTVTFTAQDDEGHTAQCSAIVTVVDMTPPVLACPGALALECSDECGTPGDDPQVDERFAEITASDVCDPDVEITDDRPVCFPEGDTFVLFIATDHDGNADSCTVTVTVEDTTPPSIDVTLSRDALWPPNHKLAEVCADVVVTDVCDPDPTFVLSSITSDEPDNARGDGNTADDIQNAAFGTPDRCFFLRSERDGGGDGRTYTIIYCASDAAGNTSYDTTEVHVGPDQGGGAFASSGFAADGKQFVGDAERVALVIPSRDEVEASLIDRSRIYLGNTAGVTVPQEIRVADIDANGQPDLVAFFLTERASELLTGPGTVNVFVPTEEAGSKDKDRGNGPVGLHYVSATGGNYLVSDIFALGTPVALPGIWVETPPPIYGSPDIAETRETGLKSIHPNPFNPQTTVEFTLLSPGRVTIAIYSVTGTLVRRLVDETRPAGDHAVEWRGEDDAGRQTASGIYFVRMIAGSYTETRKIVMLK